MNASAFPSAVAYGQPNMRHFFRHFVFGQRLGLGEDASYKRDEKQIARGKADDPD